ncbi:MAG: metal ABC transporter permease [Actinomycetes bacterium]
MELLEFDFMRRALLAAFLVGLVAPTVGVFVVQRRLALVGDGMGHVALTGVALGLVTGGSPVPVALAVTVAGAVALELARAGGRASGDQALAILFYGGIAGGVVIASKAPDGSVGGLTSYLFGSITTTTADDLTLFVVLAVVVLTVTALLYRDLFAVSYDEDYARAAGRPVLALNVVLAVMVAVTVVLSMRIVGLLLISALMVIPVATAQLVGRSFRGTLLLSVVISLAVGEAGVVGSYYADTPSGGSIVVLAVALFAVVAGWSWGRTALHRRRAGAQSHFHEHGEHCGHQPVQHGDHVDYLHDGHRHAAHAGHYDEH